MSANQEQDLVFFQDNSLISDEILKSTSSFLSIISHVQGTSATWLINSLIENSLVSTAGLVNKDLNRKIANRSEVIFISFFHSEEFYVKNCKRNGLDLSLFTNFKFVDCFNDLFSKKIPNPLNASSSISKLFDDIIKTVTSSENSGKIIFMESPELLLSSTNITSDELLFHLIKLNKLCRQLFIVVSQDYPQLVDLSATNSRDPVFKTTDFLVKLYHRSQLNLNLQPLRTGRANDITGCLTISKGSVPYDISNLKVSEKEYIYHVTKESSIKLFFR